MSEEKKERHPGGRPSVLTPKLMEVMVNMASIGYNNKEVIKATNIAESTLYKWLEENPEFSESFYQARRDQNIKIEQALMKAALGETITVETHEGVDANGNIVDKKVIKQHKPDIQAAKFWLINRDPERWKEKITNEIVNSEINVNIDKDDEKL